MAEKMNLAQKLIEVRKSIPFLEKEHKNTQQGYNFVSDSQVAHAIRGKMNELGIIIWPSCRKVAVIPNAKGTMLITELAHELVIEDAETGETRTCKWYSHGADNADKGPNKAATLGIKYWLLKLFNVPTDKDDSDAGNGNGDSSPTTKPANQRKPSPASKPVNSDDLITPGFQKNLFRLLADASLDEEALMEKFGVGVAQVRKAQWAGIKKWIANHVKKHAGDEEPPPQEEEFDDEGLPF